MRRAAVGVVGLVVVALAAGAAVVFWSGATVVGDSAALARVVVEPFGGRLGSVRAFVAGRPVALGVREGRVIPRRRLVPGARVSVEVVVRRPGWLGWAIGSVRRVRLQVVAPTVVVRSRWVSRAVGAPLRVRFSGAVAEVAYAQRGGPVRRVSGGGRTSARLPSVGRSSVGAVAVAAAARSWERLGRPVVVRWFPVASLPVVLARPAAETRIAPLDPIRLEFAKPVRAVLGSRRPAVSPAVSGRWRLTDGHTLTFVPSGLGFSLGTDLHVRFPRALALAGRAGQATATRELRWAVPQASTLRLQQLLAAEGYLPVSWQPSARAVDRTARAELGAAVDPPAGRFGWRYPNTPSELRALWTPGRPNEVTRGAVMMFEHDHGLAVDALAGSRVWAALVADAVAGRRRDGGYSYVYVHRDVPQKLTLWHDGEVVLTSPGNTGVPAAPTALGTWPVFEHIPVGTMSGRNPDGSRYHDPGIRWISYFHGGEALHAFNRASFGTPQSLGCVELPLDAAATVWPYTPIGTLVTIEP